MPLLQNEVTVLRNYETYYCFEWAIKFNCVCKKCLQNEITIESPTFEVKSILSRDLHIYINLLAHVDKPMAFMFNPKYTCNYIELNKLYSVRISVKTRYEKLSYSKLFTNFQHFTYLDFIKFSFINDCNQMPEKVLTLTVEIFQPDNVKLISNPKNANIEKGLKSLQQSEKLSDVTIVVGEREFHVHKAILGAQSSVFLAMFENDMKEAKENKVVIEDISEQCMQQIVNYIYSGTIEKETLEALATEILIAADKYNLENLISICVDAMISSLNIDNVLKMLKTSAVDYKLDALKTCAINFIAKNIKDVVETNEFKTFLLDPENLCLMKELILTSSNISIAAQK